MLCIVLDDSYLRKKIRLKLYIEKGTANKLYKNIVKKGLEIKARLGLG